jgi:ribosomal subunit interface protein
LRVQVAARHCEIPDSVRTRTEEQIVRLTKYDPRIASADAVYEEVKRVRSVEVILSVHGGEPIVARGEGEEFRTALDKVVDRLKRILRRQRSLAKDHKGPRVAEGMSTE